LSNNYQNWSNVKEKEEGQRRKMTGQIIKGTGKEYGRKKDSLR
jgi:hypothetical protein